MKKVLLFLFSICLLCLNAQTKTYYPNSRIKVILPGVVQVNDSLFCDVNEMSNISYKEFIGYNHVYYYSIKYNIDSLRKTKSISIFNVYDDTKVVDSIFGYDESVMYDYNFDFIPYNGYYWKHPSYSKYPCIGLSHNKSLKYTKWRTDRVFEQFLIKIKLIPKYNPFDTNIFTIEKYFLGNYHGIKPDTNYLYYFEYSLPSKEEWNQALMFSNYENGKYKFPKHLTNPKQIFIDFPEYEYKNCKIKNLNNNVSEWLIDSNQYIGLNWQDSFDLKQISIVRESKSPKATIGFRNIGKWKKWK